MNRIILTVAIVISFISCSTKRSVIKYDAPGKITKEVSTPGSKDQNFVKANEWFVTMFVNSKNVNRYSDKEAGLVKGKFTLYDETTWLSATKDYHPVTSKSINAVITIRVKEDIARLEIEVTEPIYTTMYGNVEYGHTLQEVNAKIYGIGTEFVGYMFKDSENEW